MRYFINETQITGQFEHPETGAKYPGNWLSLSTAEDRATIGITELPDLPVEPPVIPPEALVPQAVPMAAARIALSRAGKLASVKAAIDGMSGQAGEEAREWFEFSSEIRRKHPMVAAMTPLIGTSADVDALFVAAQAIDRATIGA